MIKTLAALSILTILGFSTAMAEDAVKTGRSVAVERPDTQHQQPAKEKYWLSESLGHIFLVQPGAPVHEGEQAK